MGGLLIRPEREGDAGGIAISHIAAWSACVEAAGAQIAAANSEAWIRQRRMRLAELTDAQTLVAEVNGCVIGHLTWSTVSRMYPDLGRIWACYVHPDHWGTGAADRLMTAALGRLDGFSVDLEVRYDNLRARRFYERFGFRPTEATPEVSARCLVRYLRDRNTINLHAT